ncbi:hypothetical protein [Actinoplanes siamensis]|uniref:Uncharacterized protein n=1 Tax=Actinoplanes siamensis TaxID=1223317 RepID=A0A919N6H5_9ACTN|nr:hypothetical protein [Actinoplanes siamensis]GIF05221.1 hypothetical protein Asi03nite_27590 [Actinoplanes siamensis]
MRHRKRMGDEPSTVRARVRHQPDRSYVVLIDGPAGEVEVGRTGKTRDVLSMARVGAARTFGVPVEEFGSGDIALTFPRPPYGRDGQWVRIIAAENPDDPSEAVEVGLLGKAYWFDQEAAWFVTVTGMGTGVHPSEHLDFAPTVTDEEVAAFAIYIANADPTT